MTLVLIRWVCAGGVEAAQYLDVRDSKLLCQIEDEQEGRAKIVEGFQDHQGVCQVQVPAAN